MGSYTDFSINGYPILDTKSYVIPEVMTLFQESDKRVALRKLSERNELIWGKVSPEEDRDEIAVTYSCEVWKVIDRLNIMGFTMPRIRREFEAARIAEVEKYAAWLEDSDYGWCRDDLDYFTNLTFDRYVDALRTILGKRIRSPIFGEPMGDLGPIEKRILGEKEDGFFGFVCSDFRSFIRLACEVTSPNGLVAQDITDVVHAGYYEEGEPVCANSILDLTAGHTENSTRIILTEGSSDVEILKEALALLYPHLAGYYSFLDFSSVRPQGGTGSLVTIIKAFAAAGISNRIIAVFDNDTAAFDARRSLASIQLPHNIIVCSYPNLSSLETYPTVGPTGLAPFNVNGLAASIELYLGNDLLGNGSDFPVQWKGYIKCSRSPPLSLTPC